MSGSTRSLARSNSDLQTRSTGPVPAPQELQGFRDKQSLADTAHANVRAPLYPDDIDEQIRWFFARSPSQGFNTRRRGS